MIKHAIEQIGHIENYGITSLLLFFGFFAGMLVWAFFLKPEFLNRMSQLPLENEATVPQSNHTNHE